MRDAFHGELDTLASELARIARLAGQMMTTASTALQQTDREFAELVLSRRGEVTASCEE